MAEILFFKQKKECEDELTQKGAMVARLQAKASQIGNILTSLEKKYERTYAAGSIPEEGESGEKLKKSNSASLIQGPPTKKKFNLIQPIPPFNPNKQRQSLDKATMLAAAVGQPKTEELPKMTAETPVADENQQKEIIEQAPET